jgi:quercetin 2,3-dioxygenase
MEKGLIREKSSAGGDYAALEILLIAGLPLNEPIARYGPFVMNTEAEIHQAFEDYRMGRMGAISS